jgi:hypothetical protein
VEGVVDMVLDATQHFDRPITQDQSLAGMQPFSKWI